MTGTDWGVGQVLLSFVWLALFFIWIMLLIMVFVDIFRSHDLGGLAKALWVIAVIVFPYLGVFLYLIIRGGKMSEHAVVSAQQNQAATDAYIRQAAGSSAADELAKLAELKASGAIDEAEFQEMKAKLVSS